MWVYQGLDILGTLLEAMGLYVLVNAFCPHREPSWRYLVPPAVFFVSVYLWTWFWEDSAYKIAVTLLLTFLAYKGLTKQPAMAILAGMMTQQIYLAAANALAETAAFFLLDEMTVVVEGQQFLRPVVYGLYFLFQIAFMLFFRFFLRKYAGGLDKRSVLAIALPFLLIEVLVHLLTVPFHNGQLGWFNVYWELGILLIAMLFLVLLVYIKNNLFLREQEQRSKLQIAHLQQQFAYYQDKQKEEERVRALYHDLKNHLLVLEQQPSTEAAHRMAETLRGQIAPPMRTTSTPATNFWTSSSRTRQPKPGRRGSTSPPRWTCTGPISWTLGPSTPFGNALDNAIEASEKLPEGQRLITLQGKRIRDMLLVTVENRAQPESTPAQGTFQGEDPFSKAGIPNMCQAKERYGGQIQFQQSGETFRLKLSSDPLICPAAQQLALLGTTGKTQEILQGFPL